MVDYIFCKVVGSNMTRMDFTVDAACQFCNCWRISKAMWIVYSEQHITDKTYEEKNAIFPMQFSVILTIAKFPAKLYVFKKSCR